LLFCSFCSVADTIGNGNKAVKFAFVLEPVTVCSNGVLKEENVARPLTPFVLGIFALIIATTAPATILLDNQAGVRAMGRYNSP